LRAVRIISTWARARKKIGTFIFATGGGGKRGGELGGASGAFSPSGKIRKNRERGFLCFLD